MSPPGARPRWSEPEVCRDDSLEWRLDVRHLVAEERYLLRRPGRSSTERLGDFTRTGRGREGVPRLPCAHTGAPASPLQGPLPPRSVRMPSARCTCALLTAGCHPENPWRLISEQLGALRDSQENVDSQTCNNIHSFLKMHLRGFPGGAVVENPPANAGDTGASPGLGRSHMPRSN